MASSRLPAHRAEQNVQAHLALSHGTGAWHTLPSDVRDRVVVVVTGRSTSPDSVSSRRMTPGSRRSESSTGCDMVASHPPPGTSARRNAPSESEVADRPSDGSSTRTRRTSAPTSGRMLMLSNAVPLT